MVIEVEKKEGEEEEEKREEGRKGEWKEGKGEVNKRTDDIILANNAFVCLPSLLLSHLPNAPIPKTL